MPTLTCDQIKEAVRKYNSEQTFKHDLALRAALGTIQSQPPSLGRFVAEVCVVADWGSLRLQVFPFEDRVAMAGEIERCWPLLQAMRSWRNEDWCIETTIGPRAVDVLSCTHLLQPMPDANRQPVFLSKYLHWCINDAFPIWDRNSLKALGQKDDTTWELYKGWVGQIRQESVDHRACCLEQMRLPGEGLLRTLDKSLYIIGKRKVDLADCLKIGGKLLSHRSLSKDAWIEWASDVDKWLRNTSGILQSDFGTLAVQKFVNDVGLVDGSYPVVATEFQQRMLIVNRRLQNLDAIAQRPDAYLPVDNESTPA